jgi:hypothetical protein
VSYEGWHKSWESQPTGLPEADIKWLRDDHEFGMFQPMQIYTVAATGESRKRFVLKKDRMWFHPPEPPGVITQAPRTPHAFFRARVFFWRPVGVWRYSIRCPRSDCPAANDNKAFLHR